MYDAVMCDDGGDQGLVMMGEGGGDSLSAGPGVTMEMWTPGTRTLPQPGLCTALLHRTRIHIILMFTTQGAPLEPFSAPQWSCNYWLATVTTGQHVRRQRGHLVTAQVTNPPPGSRSNTTQTSYHIYLELELGTPLSTIDNCKNKSEYYRLAF